MADPVVQQGENEEYRDFSLPFSENELLELRKLFESMPTYRSSDSTVGTEDFREILARMRFERTEEQIQGYVDYWEKHNNGRMHMDEFLDLSSVTHRTSVLSYVYALKADKDKDGIITSEEFADILRLMALHDPKLHGKTYNDFMAETDTQKNGEVSLSECAAWIEGHSANNSIWELSKTPYVWEDPEPHD